MESSSKWGPLIVRLAIGGVMIVHGIGKLFGIGPVADPIPQFTDFLASQGLPAAPVLAWLVGLVEFGGGVLLVIGLLTRYAALAIATDMLVAIVVVHIEQGFDYLQGGYEYALVLLVISLSLVASGPGPISLTNLVFGEEPDWPLSGD